MMQRPMKVTVTIVDGLRREVEKHDIFMHVVPSRGDELILNGKFFKVLKQCWHFVSRKAVDGGGHTQTASLTIREEEVPGNLNC